MSFKKILKKLSCRIFFCVGSKCSYNEKGKGQFKIDLSETNILTNNNESEIIESSKNTANI